jgi:hypothetical protein
MRGQLVLDITTGSAVTPSGGTLTFPYPAGWDQQRLSTEGSTLAADGNSWAADVPQGGLDFYDVRLGATAAYVTLKNGLSIPGQTKVWLGLFELDDEIPNGTPIGNVKAKTVPKTASFTLSAAEKGAYVHVNSASAVVVSLPNDWQPGDACVIYRRGNGAVTWTALAGATIERPASQAAHTGIAERYGELLLRVVENADGATAVWNIQGVTS